MEGTPNQSPAKHIKHRRYSTMLAEKKRLSFTDIEAQAALELPDREMMLVTVVIANAFNDFIEVNVKNNNIAVQVCAIVELINVELLTADVLTCEIEQNQ